MTNINYHSDNLQQILFRNKSR